MADGAQGPQGIKGSQGPKGPQGDVGPQGNQGDVGPQGNQGDQGPQGDVGPQGNQGDQGPQGDVGPQGNQGDQGPQGDVGPQGNQGDAGSQGNQGDQGPQGDVGPQGNQGDVGPQGNQGDQGPQGDAGPQGDQGPQGTDGFGNQGPQGDQGDQGPQGDVGTGAQDCVNSILLPVGFVAGNITAVTTSVTNTTYFQYMGRTTRGSSTVSAMFNVTTQAATITWAEVGIFRGTVVMNGGTSLELLGYADVSAVFNSTGRKVVTISLGTAMAERDDIWIAYGCQASTLVKFRGGVVDDLQTGMFQSSAGQLSTFTLQSTNLVASSLVPAWCAIQF